MHQMHILLMSVTNKTASILTVHEGGMKVCIPLLFLWCATSETKAVSLIRIDIVPELVLFLDNIKAAWKYSVTPFVLGDVVVNFRTKTVPSLDWHPSFSLAWPSLCLQYKMYRNKWRTMANDIRL